MASIKESLELLDGVKIVAVTGAKVFADGKINFADLSKLTALAVNFNVLKDAIVGVGDVKDELKDLDSAEIQELALKALEIVNAVKNALND